MPRHWIAALIVVVAVAAGVTAFALASDDDGSDVTAVTSSTPSTDVGATTTEAASASSSSPSTDAGTTTAGSSTTEVASTTLPCPVPTGSTDPYDGGIGDDTQLLTDVEVVTEERCEDRVVFAFRSTSGGEPGVAVEYASPPFAEEGSGAPVDVVGSAFVVVRFEPAATFDFVAGEPSYNGPSSIAADGPYVREVRLAGAFEGAVTWIIGLDAQIPFRVAPGSDSLEVRFGPQ